MNASAILLSLALAMSSQGAAVSEVQTSVPTEAVVTEQAKSVATEAESMIQENIIDPEFTQDSVVEEQSEYFVKQGEITEVTQEGDTYDVLVGTPMDGMIFKVQANQLIIDTETLAFLTPDQLKTGMEVTVVVPKDTIMTLSLPAICGEQVAILVNHEGVFSETAYFDEELINENHTLALNVDENTTIMNTTGERRIFTADDIKNHDAIVIFTATTRSIPAQTAPKFVMVLPERATMLDENVEVVGQE